VDVAGGAEAALWRVDVGPTSLRVSVRGSGPPLLLINGIGTRLEMWGALADRLARTRKVITFDAPGTGGSPPVRRLCRMRGLATLVDRMLDALREPRVDVLGYSWGGALAQQLAHDAARRVGRLVLISTTPGLGGQPPSLAAAALLMASPLYFVLGGRSAAVVSPIIFGEDLRRGGEAGRDLGRWLDQAPGPLGFAAQAYAITGWTSLPWLHRISQPTLVVGGGDDPLAPVRNARLLASRIPDARLKVIPDGGHLWLLERVDAAAALIERFLGG
jgi:poly(3-hydroxyalkanoate) depolymerase